MTIQEAIQAMQFYKEKLYNGIFKDKIGAFDVAISALEKQIPKKPRVMKVHDISGYKYGDCHCGEHIMDDEKYCSNCGQALDWGKDNE